jgi:hypothetical protein
MGNDPNRAVLVWAAGQRCENESEWGEGCTAPECGPCRAEELLGELYCHCGKYELSWRSPFLSDAFTSKPGINHTPEQCAPNPTPTHCPTCKQLLPTT